MRLMRVQVGLKLTADVCTNKCHHCMKRIDHNSWLTIPQVNVTFLQVFHKDSALPNNKKLLSLLKVPNECGQGFESFLHLASTI